MLRLRLLSVLTIGTLALLNPSTIRGEEKWATIKGQVVLPAATAVPAAKPINVTADKEHCLSKGVLNSDELIVNEKTKGVKNVWVYLRPAAAESFKEGEIHPDLTKHTPKEHVVDQPCCAFVPRVLVTRAGDTLLVKNSSPVPHNINFKSDDLEFNQTIAAGGSYKTEKPLTSQKGPASFACNVHPWMGGRVVIFDHPYYALTDDDGKFEIKNAPVGSYRITYRHELGYHKGRDGAKGFPVNIVGPKLEMKPLELVLPESK
jgi:plastocyanin